MITVDQLPEKAIDAARLAMAIALADDGDGAQPPCVGLVLLQSRMEILRNDENRIAHLGMFAAGEPRC